MNEISKANDSTDTGLQIGVITLGEFLITPTILISSDAAAAAIYSFLAAKMSRRPAWKAHTLLVARSRSSTNCSTSVTYSDINAFWHRSTSAVYPTTQSPKRLSC
jgi:hypothetical protein